MLHLIYLGVSLITAILYGLSKHLFKKLTGYFLVGAMTISGYIALFALHVGIFCLVGATINEKKLPKSIHTFYRWFGLLTLKVFVDSFRFKIRISGKEKLPEDVSENTLFYEITNSASCERELEIFVETCKEMIRRYGGGEFTRGIFYTVKGVRESDEAIVFDFRIVASRTVKAAKPKKRSASGRIVGRHSNTSEKAKGKSEESKSERPYITMAGQSQSLSGFSMPAMSRTF